MQENSGSSISSGIKINERKEYFIREITIKKIQILEPKNSTNEMKNARMYWSALEIGETRKRRELASSNIEI